MDVFLLSRLQFAFTIAFHYIFPPLSIGLGVLLVIMEACYLKTRDPLYLEMTKFWSRLFGLIFALGVASGIVMEFQFGTNWSVYSRYVGDVFGSALAAEGIFAFFLESGFLAILLFGWNRVKPVTHFIATCMVALGAHFSAVWIIVANSWQQTPAGHHIVGFGDSVRAEIVDFWQVVFNPSSLHRLSHTVAGAWQAGAFLVLSVAAFYLLRKKHLEFSKASFRIALPVAVIASLLQLLTGHASASGVAQNQPAKLAAFEGHYPASAPADMFLFGWVNEKQERVQLGFRIPGMLSWMVHGDRKAPVTGLQAFPPDARPPVNLVFQTYHLMVLLGMGLIGLALLALLLQLRNRLFVQRWLLWIFVFAVLGPQAANQLGWASAEVGRQPWIVQNLLRTRDAFSPNVSGGELLFSLVMFFIIYALLLALFIYLLNDKIQHGPDDSTSLEGHRA
ncbi:MAG TPA: cytochrome ubiquinol oxidase subunit I [bacterium]|nr:cytochrome ubiquinol oxidase subunit I [bacterium]HQI48523.1 cytochrome ubiquinol oxidase subunit I [bacterium]HQJ64060.1 cytochrome ubiquinol oxidase subunit I [bacterium]